MLVNISRRRLCSLGAMVALSSVKAFPALAVESATDIFVQKAGVSGLFEIESSKLAAKKTQNPDVQKFAEMMIQDHTSAAEELKKIAQSASPKHDVPAELDAKHKDMLGKLSDAADDFDPLYVDMQVKAHEEAVALFSGYGDFGDQAPFKAFAKKTLPTLEKHLQLIKDISQKVGK